MREFKLNPKLSENFNTSSGKNEESGTFFNKSKLINLRIHSELTKREHKLSSVSIHSQPLSKSNLLTSQSKKELQLAIENQQEVDINFPLSPQREPRRRIINPPDTIRL